MNTSNGFSIRPATSADASLLLTLIKELAAYEKMANQVVATMEDVEKTLFGSTPAAHALIGEENGEPVAFALYFHNYSTFLCKLGIYIEDIYVREGYRGKGYGTSFFRYICQVAEAKEYGRVEWWCLDWNNPSIDFYVNSLGAEPMSEWTVYRLDRAAIKKVAHQAS